MKLGGKKLEASVLTNGTVKIKLPRPAKAGKVKLKVTYLPGTGFTGAKDSTKIRVIQA